VFPYLGLKVSTQLINKTLITFFFTADAMLTYQHFSPGWHHQSDLPLASPLVPSVFHMRK
jgi:hypothetical protein